MAVDNDIKQVNVVAKRSISNAAYGLDPPLTATRYRNAPLNCLPSASSIHFATRGGSRTSKTSKKDKVFVADIIAKLYLKFQVPGIFLSFYINKDTKIATSQNLENVSHLVILSLGLH